MMYDYVKEIVTTWDKEVLRCNGDGFKLIKHKMKGKSSTAPEDLFRVGEDSVKLEADLAMTFHNIVMKTLFVSKRARLDTSTAIAFLMKRVREPGVDNGESSSI